MLQPKAAKRLRTNMLGLAFASPWIIGFLVLSAYPILASAVYSLNKVSLMGPMTFVGFGNYADLFDNERFFKAIQNTLWLLAIAVPVWLLGALGMALLLNTKVRFRALFRTVFYIPSIVPAVASTILWIWIFNGRFGLFNEVLGWFNISGPLWLLEHQWTKPAMLIMGLWGLGGSMLIFLASLQDVPGIYYEAAEIDGANGWQRLIRITLPAISPVLLFQLIMGIIGAMTQFTQAYLMTANVTDKLNSAGGGPQDSLLFYCMMLYQEAFQNLRMGTASAMAWLLFLGVGIITGLVFLTSLKWVYYGGDD